MALAPGTRIGFYEVVDSIGSGGMGEVYEARDTKLNRTVALKILPQAFANDRDRLARFKREAQTLASLNHPNIAAIYGFEDSGITDALVMELVPGRTLGEVITTPMPLSDALSVARQIAAALEAAHEQNVVHRDLKPANVKVTDDGTVKVLDFGLAKAMDPAGSSAHVLGASRATVTSPAMTEIGMLLGTAGYMAPEQAKGKAVDRRADIWALGVVLFEMLAGKALYRGETVTETIAHVITQPPDWTLLPASTPAPIRRLLKRCLEKDPRNRLQSAGDARIEIDEFLAAPPTPESAPAATPSRPAGPAWRHVLPWAIATVLAAALGYAHWPKPDEPSVPMRLEVLFGGEDGLISDDNGDGALAVLSPDGRTVAYASGTTVTRKLLVRSLDSLESKVIPGSDGAIQQFFSPDSKSLAFWANGKLLRVPLGGGSPIEITAPTDFRGGTWGPDNTIVYAGATIGGLMRVSAASGSPTEITKLTGNERTHRWPFFLPDGKAVLFVCQTADGSYDDGTIEAVRLDTGDRKVLIRGGTFPQYVSSGHLLYVRQNTLYAVAFDPVGLEVHGEPKPVLPGVASTGSAVGGGIGNGSAQFSVSATGTLAYLPSVTQQDAPSRLALVDRNGRIKYEYRDKKHFRDPRFSPDGKRIAVRIGDGRSERLHVLDPERGTLTNLNFTGNLAALPLWTKDGESLVYASDRGGKGLESYLSRIDGTGETITLTSGGVNGETRAPTSFSPDGTQLLVTSISGAGPDVAVLSMADRKLTPFLSSRAAELFGRFSPDGRWVAYMLQDSPTAMPNVFVRSYPDGGALRQASVEGGGFPIWTKKGAELVYFMIGLGGKNSSVLAVDVTADGKALAFGKPRELFNLPMALPGNAFWYDANSDGSLFAVLLTGSKDQQQAAPVSQTHVTLVFNFFDEIRKATAK